MNNNKPFDLSQKQTQLYHKEQINRSHIGIQHHKYDHQQNKFQYPAQYQDQERQLCFKCHKFITIYNFEKHLHECSWNKEQRIQNKQANFNEVKRKQQRQLEYSKEGEEYDKQKGENDNQYNQYEWKLEKKEQIPEERDIQQFKEKYNQISKIISASKIKSRPQQIKKQVQNQQINQNPSFLLDHSQKIPCPFCNIPLTLPELTHVQQCNQAIPCQYCLQKFPIHKANRHQFICQKRLDAVLKKYKNNKHKQIQNRKNKYKKDQKYKGGNHHYQQNYIKRAQIKHNIDNKNINEPKPQQKQPKNKPIIQQQIYNSNDFDLQSRIKANQQKGLTTSQFNRLGYDFFASNQNHKEAQCSICTSNIQQDNKIITLPCFHFFHADCIQPWLNMKSRCPTCKAKITI